MNRREMLVSCASLAAMAAASTFIRSTRALSARTQFAEGSVEGDRVIVCNEDSQTFSVIDSIRDEVMTTLNRHES